MVHSKEKQIETIYKERTEIRLTRERLLITILNTLKKLNKKKN